MFPDLPSGRRLTEAERLQLAELERRLEEDDPALVRAFGAGPSPTRAGGAPPLPPLPRAALAVFAAVAAVLLVAAAVVGGIGGAVAVVVALAGTAGVITLRYRLRNRRGPRTAEPTHRVAG